MIIAKGKVVSDGTPAELEGQAPTHNTVLVTVSGVESTMAHERFLTVKGVNKIEDQGKDGDLVRLRILSGRWAIDSSRYRPICTGARMGGAGIVSRSGAIG